MRNACQKVAFRLFFLFLLGNWLFFVSDSAAQIILTEVMFDPDTLEFHNEFVEIFNLGNAAVDLNGWLVGDSLELDRLVEHEGGLILQPGQYAVILDRSYFENSTTYDGMIPGEALILTIDDGSFGKSGWSNSHSEPVILVNARGDTVQRYCYSPGNVPGYSDEKILLTADNDSTNWRDSRHFRGTPGSRNSVTPFRYDLALDSVRAEPAFPIEGVPLTLAIRVLNAGLEQVNRFTVRVFEDLNRDSVAQESEILDEQTGAEQLSFREESWFSLEIGGLEQGEHRLGAQVVYPPDEDSTNNTRFLDLLVEAGEPDLIINEILYAPHPGEQEWLELFNRGSRTLDLDRWYLADARDTVVITTRSRLIEPGEFLVLAGDSVAAEQYRFSPKRLVVVKAFPTLNNDTDDLKLFSPSGRLMERVNYSSTWMGRETSPGTSLERIQPGVSSQLADNWTASVDPDGSTPGRRNSVYVEVPPGEDEITVQPNPFSPDGDGFEDFVVIQYRFNLTSAFLSVDVFDILGRHVRQLAHRRPVAARGSLIWDGKDDQQRIVPMGMYILFFRLNDARSDLYRELKTTVVVAKR